MPPSVNRGNGTSARKQRTDTMTRKEKSDLERTLGREYQKAQLSASGTAGTGGMSADASPASSGTRRIALEHFELLLNCSWKTRRLHLRARPMLRRPKKTVARSITAASNQPATNRLRFKRSSDGMADSGSVTRVWSTDGSRAPGSECTTPHLLFGSQGSQINSGERRNSGGALADCQPC